MRLSAAHSNPNAKDDKGVTPLHLAALFGPASVVGQLLEAGADPNAKDNETGTSSLHMAAREGHGRIVRLLLEGGAALNAKDNEGATPLFLAMEGEHALVIALLNQAGGKL